MLLLLLLLCLDSLLSLCCCLQENCVALSQGKETWQPVSWLQVPVCVACCCLAIVGLPERGLQEAQKMKTGAEVQGSGGQGVVIRRLWSNFLLMLLSSKTDMR